MEETKENSENTENPAILIGITGGIGSGKSTVADMIEDAGFTVLSADIFAAVLMEVKPEIRAALHRTFGARVFRDDGTVNRPYLAERVFGDTPEQKKSILELNKVVHPFVLDELLTKAEELASEGEQCIFIEIPLLYEIGLEDAFDYVLLVIASEQIRIERVMSRSNLTEAQIRARMAEQAPPEHMKAIADFVIENNGTIDKLQQSVDFIVQIVPHLPPAQPDEEDSMQSDGEDSI